MRSRSQIPRVLLVLTILLSTSLAACARETIEVTRIKIMERRVIERVVVTVEVTRVQQVTSTPQPTSTHNALAPADADGTLPPSTGSPSPTVTPTVPRLTPLASATRVSSAKRIAESLLEAITGTEQTFLSLVQALNSDPLPAPYLVQLYDTLGAAPSFAVPEGEVELQAFHIRYREQIDYARGQATDLYTHLTMIQSGEADQTEVSPTHLSLARDAASAGTSALQALMRELETYLASLP